MAKCGIILVPDFLLLRMVSPLKVFDPPGIDVEFNMCLALWLWESHLIALCICIFVCMCVSFFMCKARGMASSHSSGIAMHLPHLEYDQKHLGCAHSNRIPKGNELLLEGIDEVRAEKWFFILVLSAIR